MELEKCVHITTACSRAGLRKVLVSRAQLKQLELCQLTRAGDCARIMYSSLSSAWFGESPNGLLFLTLEVDF